MTAGCGKTARDVGRSISSVVASLLVLRSTTKAAVRPGRTPSLGDRLGVVIATLRFRRRTLAAGDPAQVVDDLFSALHGRQPRRLRRP